MDLGAGQNLSQKGIRFLDRPVNCEYHSDKLYECLIKTNLLYDW